MELEGKTAVVTGTSSGIGKELAAQLLGRGAAVYGISRRESRFDDARFTWIEADLAAPGGVQEAFRRIRERAPLIHLLVNNAGFGRFGDVECIEPGTWSRMLALNLEAPLLAAREVVPAMKARHEGMILNIASIAGKRGFKGGTAYCATKFGMVGLSEALMEELREFGIRVSCICPGSVDTPFFHDAGLQPAKTLDPAELARFIVAAIETPDSLLPDQIVLRPC